MTAHHHKEPKRYIMPSRKALGMYPQYPRQSHQTPDYIHNHIHLDIYVKGGSLIGKLIEREPTSQVKDELNKTQKPVDASKNKVRCSSTIHLPYHSQCLLIRNSLNFDFKVLNEPDISIKVGMLFHSLAPNYKVLKYHLHSR